MGDSTNQNKEDDTNIASKLPGVLKIYKESSFSLQLKAQIFYKICMAAIFALFILIVSSSYVQLYGPENKLNYQILIPTIVLLLVFIVSLFLLIKGKFNIASHLFLISANICLWYIMFFSKTGHILIKFDTIVIVLAIINTIPLFIHKYKSTIIIYVVGNLALLFLFVQLFKNDYGLTNSIIVDYLVDVSIAILFSGVAAYQIVRINNKALNKVEADYRKRIYAEKALKESELRYRTIFEDTQVGIYQTTPDGEVLKANPALLKMLGYSDLESLSARNLTENGYFLSNSRKDFVETIHKHGFIKDYKTEWMKNNGEKIIIRENARVVRDDSGGVKYYEGFVVDITEREKVMKALAESEEKYRGMAELLPVAIWEINLIGICTYANNVGFKIHGFTPEDLVNGINVLELIIPEQRDYATNNLKKKLEGFVSQGDEYVAVRKDGTTFPAKIYTSVIYQNKKPVGFIGVTIDISEAKKAEQEVKESEEQLKMALLGAKLGMWDWNIENNTIKVNDLFVEMLGYTLNDFVGGILTFDDWKKMLHQEDFNKAIQLFNEHVEKKTELYEAVFRMKHKNGDWKWILARGKVAKWIKGEPMRALGTHLDITTRKKAEQELEKYRKHLEFLVQERTEELATANEELTSTNEELLNQRQELETVLLNLQDTQKQLVHSEKMASLGVLASGIAHEINNPLNFIKGGVFGIESYVKENLKESLNELNPFLDGVNEGICRAAEIVKSLNHYNRRNDAKMIACDIHSIIENCLVMLNNQIKDRITVEKKYTTKKFVLACNEGKLHQAILNVLSNAAHAIENEGIIKIKSFVKAKDFKLEVTDTGTGISNEHIDKILDPFFTTKAPGKGTGLGLSITYNILQEHNGTIEFKSKLHKGTTVIITLPLKTKPDEK